MKDRRVTVLDEAARAQYSLPYGAIVPAALDTSEGAPNSSPSQQRQPTPPPEIARRDDLKVGHRASFTDQNLQHRLGLIVRLNQRTATLDCDGQTWRVAFGLLRHVVNAEN
jgi:hypothetical protein